MIELTSKQEKFAQEVASGKSLSDAYRASFNVRKSTKPESVNQAASRLMANANIASRVDALREPIIREMGITLEAHLNELATLRDAAKKDGQFSAAISAEVARGKAAGIHIEKSVVESTVRNLPPIKDEDWL